MLRRRLAITGRVQNVGYRDWLVREAAVLGLAGWVRNRTDGGVEAVVEGPAELVERLVTRARAGSPASRVAGVVVSEDASTEPLAGFERRPTA